MSKRTRLLTIAVASALTACSTEVPRTARARAPKSSDCAIEIYSSSEPPWRHEDIAVVESRCHHTQSRGACIADLKASACALGGDAIYRFVETRGVIRSAVVGARAKPPSCTPTCAIGSTCGDDGACHDPRSPTEPTPGGSPATTSM